MVEVLLYLGSLRFQKFVQSSFCINPFHLDQRKKIECKNFTSFVWPLPQVKLLHSRTLFKPFLTSPFKENLFLKLCWKYKLLNGKRYEMLLAKIVLKYSVKNKTVINDQKSNLLKPVYLWRGIGIQTHDLVCLTNDLVSPLTIFGPKYLHFWVFFVAFSQNIVSMRTSAEKLR